MDLSTEYLGLSLSHPLVPSASPLSSNLERIRLLEDMGASAVVMFSLFEEEIRQAEEEHLVDFGADGFLESSSYLLPSLPRYTVGPDAYLTLLSDAKSCVDIPVIASLNCRSVGGWVEFAGLLEEAGADAIELNIYLIPTEPGVSGSEVEERYLTLLREVRSQTRLPLAVKLHPFLSSLPHMSAAMVAEGAQGLVFFNRFYQPDIDLRGMEIEPQLRWSNAQEFLLPLRWTALLSQQIAADFAISTGVHTHMELLKSMMVGAKVAMIASELLAHGLQRLREILHATRCWMERHELADLEALQGFLSIDASDHPEELARNQYLEVLRSFDTHRKA